MSLSFAGSIVIYGTFVRSQFLPHQVAEHDNSNIFQEIK